jgi:hypothetical protein
VITVIAVVPGRDEVILTGADGSGLCNSLACARAGRAAEVVATFGTLNDRGAACYDRGSLWRERYPLGGACWRRTRQIAVKYRPGVVITDSTGPATAESSGGLV